MARKSLSRGNSKFTFTVSPDLTFTWLYKPEMPFAPFGGGVASLEISVVPLEGGWLRGEAQGSGGVRSTGVGLFLAAERGFVLLLSRGGDSPDWLVLKVTAGPRRGTGAAKGREEALEAPHRAPGGCT